MKVSSYCKNGWIFFYEPVTIFKSERVCRELRILQQAYERSMAFIHMSGWGELILLIPKLQLFKAHTLKPNRYFSLSKACSHFRRQHNNAHRAAADALACVTVWQGMMESHHWDY